MVETKREMVEQFRRSSIQTAARQVIARRGLAGTSMQAVAAQAGVAKGTVYLYFKDREDLLESAASEAFEDLVNRLQAVLARSAPLPETLRALVRTKIEFFDANQEFLRVHLDAGYPGGAVAARCRRRRSPHHARYIELLTAYLENAVERGEMRPLEPARVAWFLAEGVAGLLLRRLSEKGRSAKDDVDWIVELLLNGLGPFRRTS